MTKAKIGLSMNYMQLGQYHQFHIRDRYIDAVHANGGLPIPIPCMNDKADLKQYLQMVGALIIIGGLDYPPRIYDQSVHPKADLAHDRRVRSDFLLLETALAMNLPILGICAGMQLMNIYFGGKLIQHLDEVDYHMGEKFHPIKLKGGKWLPQIYPDEFVVNSNHHQGIDPEFIGKGLTVVAAADDGIIEAIEYESEQMILGIQWHPERIPDPAVSKPIFDLLFSLAHDVYKS